MTSKEKKGLEQWKKLNGGSAEEVSVMKRLWEATGLYKSSFQPDVNKGFARFKAKAGQSEATVVALKPRFTWLKVAAAAVIIVFAVLLFNNLTNTSGKLENITAEAGIQKSFVLSDGSTITLNESTSLEFPDNFSGAERKVKLKGEAFFKVAKDAAHPFIVETPQAEVQVLGTSFNVREYPGEGMTEVFVKTGKVAVTLKTTGEKHILLPGDKLTFETATSMASKTKDNLANSLAWKNGRLIFDEKPIDEILKSVERLHHVRFVYKNESLHSCTFSITLDATRLKDVLNSFELACPGISIRSDGPGKFLVGGKCCE